MTRSCMYSTQGGRSDSHRRELAQPNKMLPSLFVPVAHCIWAPFFLVFFLSKMVGLMLRFQRKHRTLSHDRPDPPPVSRGQGEHLGETRTGGAWDEPVFDLMIVDTGYMDTNWTVLGLCDSDFISPRFAVTKLPLRKSMDQSSSQCSSST